MTYIELGCNDMWRIYENVKSVFQNTFGITQDHVIRKKGQYVTNAFTTTCDYLVLQLNFCPFWLMWHRANINWVTYD